MIFRHVWATDVFSFSHFGFLSQAFPCSGYSPPSSGVLDVVCMVSFSNLHDNFVAAIGLPHKATVASHIIDHALEIAQRRMNSIRHPSQIVHGAGISDTDHVHTHFGEQLPRLSMAQSTGTAPGPIE